MSEQLVGTLAALAIATACFVPVGAPAHDASLGSDSGDSRSADGGRELPDAMRADAAAQVDAALSPDASTSGLDAGPDAGVACAGGCDDNNPCTIDSCDPVDGCLHEALPNRVACGTQCCATNHVCVQDSCCPSGRACSTACCTLMEACVNGLCQPCSPSALCGGVCCGGNKLMCLNGQCVACGCDPDQQCGRDACDKQCGGCVCPLTCGGGGVPGQCGGGGGCAPEGNSCLCAHQSDCCSGTCGYTPQGGHCVAARDHEWAQWQVPPDHPTSYLIDGDTATDMVTGLMWQRVVPTLSYFWGDAASYCHGLSLGGFSDGWRLPTAIESVSIVDYTAYDPATNSAAFSGLPKDAYSSSFFWSSSPRAGTGDMWDLNFKDGTLDSNYSSGATSFVRCVRGGQTPAIPHYTSTAETVTDTWTGLTWQRVQPTLPYTPAGAATYCQGLSLGGFSTGWRLPAVKELESLVARIGSRKLDPVFGSFMQDCTVSSTAAVQVSTGGIWGVEFGEGKLCRADWVVSCVRCVR